MVEQDHEVSFHPVLYFEASKLLSDGLAGQSTILRQYDPFA